MHEANVDECLRDVIVQKVEEVRVESLNLSSIYGFISIQHSGLALAPKHERQVKFLWEFIE